MQSSSAAVALVVLAGGEGSRMGLPKGELTIAGRPILEHLLGQISWDGPTLLVTAPGCEHPPDWDRFDKELVDPVAALGPLRGIVTALESGSGERFVFVPVDMPFMSGEALRWLIEQHDRLASLGLMTQHLVGGQVQIEPLPIVLRRKALPILRTRLEAGRRSIYGLVGGAGFDVVTAPHEWSEKLWTNLNLPGDLEAIGGHVPS